MKKVFTFLAAVIFTASVFAQSLEKMSYQAVIRNSSDALVTNTQIGMEINIRQGSPTGTVVYSETQTPTTNANGLVSIEIGGGTGFDTINWANGSYFIETKTAVVAPLTTYTITGTSQLLSVPYALHAKTAETVTGTITETDPVFGASIASSITGTDTTNWNNKLDAEVDGSVTNEIQALSISNDTIYLSNGGFVKLPAADITHYVGELYGGGVVFWVSPDGQHGLVMSLDDVISVVTWSNITSETVGNAYDMYDGLANSNAIVAQPGHTTSAAKLCLDYSSDGFSDWYLPASWQISQIYHNAYTINYVLAIDGNAATVPLVTNQTWSVFPFPVYWSSTEGSSVGAWGQGLQFGYTTNYSKTYSFRVRAVRAF